MLQTPAFIEVLTLTDDQLIRALISSTWLLLTLLTPVEAVRVHLVFNTASAFLLRFCSIYNNTVSFTPYSRLTDISGKQAGNSTALIKSARYLLNNHLVIEVKC